MKTLILLIVIVLICTIAISASIVHTKIPGPKGEYQPILPGKIKAGQQHEPKYPHRNT